MFPRPRRRYPFSRPREYADQIADELGGSTSSSARASGPLRRLVSWQRAEEEEEDRAAAEEMATEDEAENDHSTHDQTAP